MQAENVLRAFEKKRLLGAIYNKQQQQQQQQRRRHYSSTTTVTNQLTSSPAHFLPPLPLFIAPNAS